MSQLKNHTVFDITIHILHKKKQVREYMPLNNTQLTTLCFNYLGPQLMIVLQFILQL